jgi:CO dehydrogenase maturation factor
MTKTIAVAGKGGTGKSTIAAMIIEYLRREKLGSVLAIDADPDSNLGSLIGLSPEQTIGELRDDFLKEIQNFPPGMTKANYIEAGLHGIIEESSAVDFIAMGKGEGAGCYCFINSIIKKFCDDLAPSYDWVVLDNEAGLEHIARRTTIDVDLLLVVVSENPLSLQCATSVREITDGLESRVRNRYVVTNMIREDRLQSILDRVGGTGLDVLASIPFDPAVDDLIFKGEPLTGVNSSPVFEPVGKIIATIGGGHGVT